MKEVEATLTRLNEWYPSERDLYRVSVVIFTIAGWNRNFLKPFQLAKGAFYLIRSGKTAVCMVNRGFQWKDAVWTTIYLVKGGVTVAKFLPRKSKGGKFLPIRALKYLSKTRNIWKMTWKPNRLVCGVRAALWIRDDLKGEDRYEKWVAYLGAAEVLFRRLKPFAPSIILASNWGR